MPGTFTLFVYGTLKRGCRNHGAMRGAEFAGEAATEPAYLLVNCGSYPGLVRAGKGQAGMAIRGELYRMDEAQLAELDRFEDEGVEYVRGPIRLADGSEAQAYFYALPVAGLELFGEEWPC
jgi:gamma-glutamylcyclotransferase (GGCT)/AIG2-like uncharacterized protein YtfP